MPAIFLSLGVGLLVFVATVAILQREKADYIAGYSVTMQEDGESFIMEAEDCITMMNEVLDFGEHPVMELYYAEGVCTSLWNKLAERDGKSL